MLDDFFLRALLGGIGVALLAGPLGCFVVWRRMAYLGDSLAHGALLGVALGMVLSIDLTIGIVAVSVALVAMLLLLQRQRHLAGDTLLVILAHGALSLGLVAVSFVEGQRLDLMAYLFGDILAVGRTDLIWIYAGGVVILSVIVFLWRPLLALTVHEELARAEGARATLVSIAFMLLMALTVALAMKIVGILLIASLLIIPAAAARRLARTPEQMAVLASLAGVLSVVGGLYGSLEWDTPSGPSIVVAALAVFLIGLAIGAGRRLIPARHRPIASP
ncbi:MAG: metal ABC transporter permease [Alphaproteobacteria bacterium]